MIIYHQQSMRKIQKLIKNASGKVLTHHSDKICKLPASIYQLLIALNDSYVVLQAQLNIHLVASFPAGEALY